MIASKTVQTMIDSFEGVRLTSYQDSVGRWTIGYGHTGADVTPGMVITQAQAYGFLAVDLGTASNEVNVLVVAPLLAKGFRLSQNEFDALVDFCFNLGGGCLKRSTMLKYILAYDWHNAAEQFEMFDHAGGKVVAGLLRRRIAEEKLFES